MENLDDAYANAAHIPNADRFVPHWEETAKAFREKQLQAGRAYLDMAYGPTERQRFDHFLPSGPSKDILIFVHGGYWLRFDKSYWSHLAKGALDLGLQVAMPSYDLCPSVRISDISRQIAKAVEEIAKHSTGKIALAGHSAGGHLVARMAVGDLLAPEVMDRISHVMPISPVGDLRPLRQTAMNDSFELTQEDAIAESPTLMPKPTCPVTVWAGANERPVFIDQAQWLAHAWSADIIIEPEKHHFDVIESLEEAQSDMLQKLLNS